MNYRIYPKRDWRSKCERCERVPKKNELLLVFDDDTFARTILIGDGVSKIKELEPISSADEIPDELRLYGQGDCAVLHLSFRLLMRPQPTQDNKILRWFKMLYKQPQRI